jgi:hypothetical protein
MTIVAIHQPQYLPWVPYCDKADACDIFVYLDNTQYQKNGLQNRNQIKTIQSATWLTVPVQVSLGQHISEVRIANTYRAQKHIRTIDQSYTQAKAFGLFRQGLKSILEQSWDYLADLDIAVTEWMFAQLGITCQRIRASELGVNGAKDDLILAICRAVGADVYLSGQGAKTYQDEAKFRENGVELHYQQYENQPYRQCFPDTPFIPDLSALDLILNMGDEARAVMLAGRTP